MSLYKKEIPTKENLDIEWGNRELPTLSDEELLSKNWERIDINKRSAIQRDKDGSFTKKMTKRNRLLAKQKHWLEANRKSVLKNAKNPDWLKAVQLAAKARSEKGKKLKAQGKLAEYNKLFGYIEKHSKKTLKKMSASATKRWKKEQKPLMAEGKKYKSIYDAGKTLSVHKDTISYRIKVGKKGYKWL
jgi:hypothetical protein